LTLHHIQPEAAVVGSYDDWGLMCAGAGAAADGGEGGGEELGRSLPEYPENIPLNMSSSLLSTPTRSERSSVAVQHAMAPGWEGARGVGGGGGDSHLSLSTDARGWEEEDTLGLLKLQLQLVKDKQIRINPHTGFPDLAASHTTCSVQSDLSFSLASEAPWRSEDEATSSQGEASVDVVLEEVSIDPPEPLLSIAGRRRCF